MIGVSGSTLRRGAAFDQSFWEVLGNVGHDNTCWKGGISPEAYLAVLEEQAGWTYRTSKINTPLWLITGNRSDSQVLGSLCQDIDVIRRAIGSQIYNN